MPDPNKGRNSYPGPCMACGFTVAAGEGYIRKDRKAIKVSQIICVPCVKKQKEIRDQQCLAEFKRLDQERKAQLPQQQSLFSEGEQS